MLLQVSLQTKKTTSITLENALGQSVAMHSLNTHTHTLSQAV